MIKNNNIVDFIKKNFSMAVNSLWRERDFVKLLKEAISHNTYVETIKSDNLPDPDTLHLRMHDAELECLHESFCDINRKIIDKLKGKKVILIIDDTHEPYYGKTKNAYIHEYKPKDGCKGSYKFLTAFLLVDDRKYFIDSIQMSLFTDELKAVDSILGRIEKLRIEVVLMDRWFANSLVIRLLKRHKLKYLMLCKKNAKVNRTVRKTGCYSRTTYFVNRAKTNLIVVKDRHDWTFFTNLNYKYAFKYIRIYKKRWNIETGFRVQDEAKVKTKSIDIKVRYFLFLITMLLYNVWKKLREVGVKLQFKRFLIELSDVVDNKMT